MNPEHFARFLELLTPDTEEAGRRYICLHKKLIGFFRMKGISDSESAADETINRAVSKIGAGAVVPDVDKYCLGIARNIARERYRLAHREQSVLLKLTRDSGHSSAEYVERIYSKLKPCFEQLTDDEQKLLLAYCHELKGRVRAKYRGELAKTMKITVAALRIRVTRLRSSLTDCVQKRSNKV